MALGEIGDLFEEEVDMYVEVFSPVEVSADDANVLPGLVRRRTLDSLTHAASAGTFTTIESRGSLQSISVCAAPESILQSASSFVESQST